jgi:hypothetical protein
MNQFEFKNYHLGTIKVSASASKFKKTAGES